MCGEKYFELARALMQERDDTKAEVIRVREILNVHTGLAQLRAENAMLSQHKLSLEATVKTLQGEIGRLEQENPWLKGFESAGKLDELSQAKKFLWQHSMHVWKDNHEGSDPSGVDLIKSLAELRKYLVERDEFRLKNQNLASSNDHLIKENTELEDEVGNLKARLAGAKTKEKHLQFRYEKLFEDFCKLQAHLPAHPSQETPVPPYVGKDSVKQEDGTFNPIPPAAPGHWNPAYFVTADGMLLYHDGNPQVFPGDIGPNATHREAMIAFEHSIPLTSPQTRRYVLSDHQHNGTRVFKEELNFKTAPPSQELESSKIPQWGDSVLTTLNQAAWRQQYLQLKEDYAALKIKEAELQAVVINMLKDGFGQSICALRTFNGLHLFWVDPSDEACINDRLHNGL
jgi:hypothetical protein